MKDIWKTDAVENTSVRLHFSKGVHPQLRKEIMLFLRWIRREYVFPRKIDIQISDEMFVLTFLTDEQVSASIFIPDNERFNVLIRVSTGDYLSTVQNDGYRVAVCSILGSIAHELTHYYQWVKDHDCRFNEAQARAKAVRIVSKSWDMRQTPCSFAN